MNTFLPCYRRCGGFARSTCIELLLLAYLVAAVLNLCLGNWVVATAMLLPLVGLFFWTRHLIRKDGCEIGDQIRVSLGPHAGEEGAIIGVNEVGIRFTVQLSSAEHPDPLDFSNYQITRLNLAGGDGGTLDGKTSDSRHLLRAGAPISPEQLPSHGNRDA